MLHKLTEFLVRPPSVPALPDRYSAATMTERVIGEYRALGLGIQNSG